MNDSSNPGEPQWPRDFDFREAYAEQRELLAQATGTLCCSDRVSEYNQLLRIEEVAQGRAACCADAVSLERSECHDRH